MAISKDNTPNSFDFVQSAANFRTSTAAYGDGTLLNAIMQIIEKILPMIMSCFPASSMLVEAAQDPRPGQEMRVKAMALREARKVRGLSFSERMAAAELAVDGMFGQVETMSGEDIAACYDELKGQN